MALEWGECIKIYQNGDFVVEIDREMFNAFQRYITIIRNEPLLQVWYDNRTKQCFGPEQDFYANPADFSFFSQKDNFASNPMWGERAFNNAYGNYFDGSLIKNTEIMYSNNSVLSQVKGKDILIVGAGPTGDAKYWQHIEYDQLWSCTKFYMSPVLSNLKVDLASVGGEVQLSDPNLLRYVKKYETMLGFEGGVTPYKTEEEINRFLNNYSDRSFCFHTRYFSKLGAAPRLLCLANLLGARKIYFAGFDGYPKGQNHLFEANKKHDEPWRNKHTFDLYRRQIVLLWDYLLNDINSNDTKYCNLGESHPANQTSKISKKYFPLPNLYK